MFIIDNEVAIRLIFFLGIFAIMAAWESAAPKRVLTTSKRVRWTSNLAITFLNTIVLRAVFPAAAVGMALLGEWSGWGLFNTFRVSSLIAGIICLILLDLTIYAQHVLFHKLGILWRLHKMHHTDLDIDVTTGARFHTIEILLSMIIKITIVITLGAPAWSVISFEVLLNATSMFNHSNVRMPLYVDKILRRLVVTPDMHRVHHSIIMLETNSNFGFNFPWWDRLFGTYVDQPEKGHDGMTIGLADFQDAKYLKLHWMLAVPFLRPNK